MINEKRKNQTETIIPDLGFNPSVNLSNHLLSMNTAEIALEVVRKLDLDIIYRQAHRFLDKECAYGESPIMANFIDDAQMCECRLDISIDADGNCLITNVLAQGNPLDEMHICCLGDTIETAIGLLSLTPTATYQPGKSAKIQIERLSPKAAASKVRTSLKLAQRDRSSSLIDIGCYTNSPRLSQAILEKFIETYAESWINERNEQAEATSSFLEQRLQLLEYELNEVDHDIAYYKSSTQVLDASYHATMAMEDAQQIRRKISELEQQLEMTLFVKQKVEDNRDKMRLLSVSLDNRAIMDQILAFNDLAKEWNAKVSNSSPQNPKIRKMERELSSLSQMLLQSLDNEVVTLQRQYERAIESLYNAESKISESPLQGNYLTSVGRQQKVKENLFMHLLQKREEHQLSRTLYDPPLQVVDEPSFNPTPQSPNKVNAWLSALFITLILPTAILYIKELADSRVIRREDVEHLDCLKIEVRKAKGSKNEPCVDAYGFELLKNKVDANVFLITPAEKSKQPIRLMLLISTALEDLGHSVLVLDAVDKNVTPIQLEADIRAIVAESRHQYDFVLITAPAVNDGPMASRLSLYADATLVLAYYFGSRMSALNSIPRWVDEGRIYNPAVLLCDKL